MVFSMIITAILLFIKTIAEYALYVLVIGMLAYGNMRNPAQSRNTSRMLNDELRRSRERSRVESDFMRRNAEKHSENIRNAYPYPYP
jgi:hypothetical protein